MISNYLFRLLFDYRGTITHREYWAGITAAFMCVMISLQGMALNAIYPNIVGSYWGVQHLAAYAYLQSVFYIVFNVNIPFAFIALYIFIAVTVKRCRVFSFSLAPSILIGILSYFILPCIAGAISLSLLNAGEDLSSTIRGIGDSAISAFSTIFTILTLVGIGSVVYISLKKTDEDNLEIPVNYGTNKSLTAMGCLMLAYAVLIIFLGIYGTTDRYFLIKYEENIKTFLIISLLVYNIIYFYILARRAKDGGMNPFIAIFSLIGILLLMGALAYFSMILGSPLILLMINFLNGLLLSLFYVDVFVIIARPTKNITS